VSHSDYSALRQDLPPEWFPSGLFALLLLKAQQLARKQRRIAKVLFPWPGQSYPPSGFWSLPRMVFGFPIPWLWRSTVLFFGYRMLRLPGLTEILFLYAAPAAMRIAP